MTDILNLRIYKLEDATVSIDKFGIFRFNDIAEPSEDEEFAWLKRAGQTYNRPTDVASELADLEVEKVTKQTSYEAIKTSAEQLNNKLGAGQQVMNEAQQAVNDRANIIENIRSSLVQYIGQENGTESTIKRLQFNIESEEEIMTNLESRLVEASTNNEQKLADLQTTKSDLDEVNNKLVSLDTNLKQKQASNDIAKKTLEEKALTLDETKQRLKLDTTGLLPYQQVPRNLKKARDNLIQI